MIKSNLKGAAGVQINIRDISGRPNTTSAPYRIGLVGWTPKGPSNTPVVVSTESDLYSIFGSPKGFKPSEVYLLHNAKILLNAGAEVVVVRTVQATTEETLNFGVYYTPVSGSASIDSEHYTDVDDVVTPVAISYNMDNVLLNKKNQKLEASADPDSPFTMFLKYPGFSKYYASIQTFEVGELAEVVYLYPDVTGTFYLQADGTTYSTTVHGTTKYKIGTVSSSGAFVTYSLDATNTTKFSTLETYVLNDVYYTTGGFEPVHTFNADPSDDWYSSDVATFKSYVQGLGVYSTPYLDDAGKIYGDVYVNGFFYVANGVLPADLSTLTEKNENLNKIIDELVCIRVYESNTSSSPLETIFATTNEYVTDYGDQLEITSVPSNLLSFMKPEEVVSLSVVNKSVARTELKGGASESHPNRNSQALASAWGLFADTTNVEVSLLADGGSSIVGFGTDRGNDGTETGDMTVVTAILKVSSSRMDAPCIIDLPKRSKVNDLVSYFKKYPSIGNEVDGSTAPYATFWGNAQDGRQIINDTFNKKQIEAARSVFKALVAFNVFRTSYPWQTQWGPNRGLITSPSVGTINPRTYPDEVGLLSQNRINPSRLTTTGEYFWDDYTLMAKSSVLQRWHAVCFLANLNKRYRKMLEQYVAELNTPALRKTIWNMLNDDLNFIMNHADPAGLYNYYVICDETNNTPEVIDAGQLNVDVGLEIVRDTRVINLTTTLYRTGGIVESGIKV